MGPTLGVDDIAQFRNRADHARLYAWAETGERREELGVEATNHDVDIGPLKQRPHGHEVALGVRAHEHDPG